jgi:hypothetical protein
MSERNIIMSHTLHKYRIKSDDNEIQSQNQHKISQMKQNVFDHNEICEKHAFETGTKTT